jgi:hypothetical protein
MRRSAAGGRERASGKERARGHPRSASSEARRVQLSSTAGLTAQRSERSSLRSCGSREALRSDRLAARCPQVVAPRAGALHRLAAPGGLSSGRALAISPHAPHRWAGTRRSAPVGYSAPLSPRQEFRTLMGRHLTIRWSRRGGRRSYAGRPLPLAARSSVQALDAQRLAHMLRTLIALSSLP